MNPMAKTQVNEIKKYTIGVKVKINNTTKEKAARLATDFFGMRRFENTAGHNDYCT